MAVTYATGAQVAAFLQRPAFSTSTVPTLAHVEDLLNYAEDHVDRFCNTAWRAKTVTDEYHDYKSPRMYGRQSLPSWGFDLRDSRIVAFRYRPVRTLTVGDKVEIWRGNAYEDIFLTGVEGRANDYWVDYDKGLLFFVTKWPLREISSIRLTYRYGATTIPSDIRHATILLAAASLVSGSVASFILPEGGAEPGYLSRASAWKEEAEMILAHYWEFRPDYL
jgi:hypothetical protein